MMTFSKKFALAIGFAAVTALTVAPAANAAVVSSNHDMTFKYPALNAKAGACSFCHVPHKAGGAKLWATALITGTGWQGETISQLCWSCHGATTYTGAQEILPFGTTGKHGRTVATLVSFGDIASAAALDTAIGGAVNRSADGDLKCTSCHDVHANESRPFIRFMATGTFNFQTMCQTCHPNRANAAGRGITNSIAATNGPAGAGNYSQHPTDVAIAAAGGRLEAFQATIAAEFGVVGGVQGIGTGGWNLAGHRNANLLDAGNMTCATCHAVHGNETAIANFAAADGTGNVNTDSGGYAHLEVRNPDPTAISSALCTGCHANAAILGPGTTGVSHPIDRLTSAWRISAGLGTGFPTGALNPGKWGSAGALVCQSCHDMHYAAPNTSLLRGTIDAPIGTSNSNCNACHATTTLANHHPAGVVMYAGVTPVSRTAAFNWTSYTYAAATAANGYSLAPGRIITCGTCHGGSGAHNVTGAYPGLSSINTASDMCVDCHSTNPSQYTATAGTATQSTIVNQQASHYVGTVVTTAYVRTANWGTTGLASKYTAANADIICESCHTLKLSGTIGGPTTSNNTVRGTAVRATVGLLLERNGNNNTVYNATNAGTNADLCTGCHGSSPSGGTASGAGTATHPTISMGMVSAASGPIITKVGTHLETVSLAPGSLVNCESCHRPHDAASGSGALILEAVGVASTKTAGGPAAGVNGGSFSRATGNGGLLYAEEATFCNYCHNY